MNAGTGNRKTALHIAAASGKTDIVKALLGAGARVDVADQDGNEPLHIAVANPTNGQIVKDLLNAGAKVDVANNDGMQPIHLAARSAARAPFRHSSPPVQSQMQSIFTACGPCIWLHKEARRESTHLARPLTISRCCSTDGNIRWS